MYLIEKRYKNAYKRFSTEGNSYVLPKKRYYSLCSLFVNNTDTLLYTHGYAIQYYGAEVIFQVSYCRFINFVFAIWYIRQACFERDSLTREDCYQSLVFIVTGVLLYANQWKARFSPSCTLDWTHLYALYTLT